MSEQAHSWSHMMFNMLSLVATNYPRISVNNRYHDVGVISMEQAPSHHPHIIDINNRPWSRIPMLMWEDIDEQAHLILSHHHWCSTWTTNNRYWWVEWGLISNEQAHCHDPTLSHQHLAANNPCMWMFFTPILAIEQAQYAKIRCKNTHSRIIDPRACIHVGVHPQGCTHSHVHLHTYMHACLHLQAGTSMCACTCAWGLKLAQATAPPSPQPPPPQQQQAAAWGGGGLGGGGAQLGRSHMGGANQSVQAPPSAPHMCLQPKSQHDYFATLIIMMMIWAKSLVKTPLGVPSQPPLGVREGYPTPKGVG